MIPAQHIYAPFSYRSSHADARPSVFLGGSIEMGEAEDWQALAYKRLCSEFAAIYNPRRPNWDATWKQDIAHPQFSEQVKWELDRIEHADLVILNFDPKTKSAITLQELGICAILKPRRTHVCCPEGFWRKGNVDITCERYGISSHPDFGALLYEVLVAAKALPRRVYQPQA